MNKIKKKKINYFVELFGKMFSNKENYFWKDIFSKFVFRSVEKIFSDTQI